MRRAADALADDGFEVTEVTPPDYEQAIELWATIQSADLRVMKPVLDQVMGPGGRSSSATRSATCPNRTWPAGGRAYRPARARPPLEPVVPGVPGAALPGVDPAGLPAVLRHRQPRRRVATLELMRPVLPANLLGTPAAVVPAGMADGLPVGVQVMGARYTELRCLAVAAAIEQRLGTLTPIDPVTG